MNLQEIISRYPGVRVAGPEDNQKLLDFFNQTAMEGETLRVRGVRDPDFFRLLRYQGDQFLTLIKESETGVITGIGTVSQREGWFQGRRIRIGYLGDFRIAFDRKTIRIWRKAYGDMMKHAHEVDEFRGCEVFLTAVIEDNLKAHRAFVKQNKSCGFVYDRLATYRMVNILTRKPIYAPRSVPRGFTVRRAEARDMVRLESFLAERNRNRDFGYCFDRGELQRRLSTWDGLSIDSFYLAEDASGVLRACFAPWSPSPARYYVAEKLPWYLKVSRPVLNGPREGEAIRTAYLTHLEIDETLPRELRRRIFRGMFDRFYGEAGRQAWHTIAFCEFGKSDLSSALNHHFRYSVSNGLYTVRHKETPNRVPVPKVPQRISFENALA